MSDIDLRILPDPVTDKSPGIGCIGAGFIMADCHLPAYRGLGLNVRAICSRGGDSARAAAARHGIPAVHDSIDALLADETVDVLDVAVPPDQQLGVLRQICAAPRRPRAILAQKPLAGNLADAVAAVRVCEEAGILLAVNQNMRYDHSIRACRALLQAGALGEPVLATIDMRAIPHWMPWQAEQGWCTLRIMSIHHLDTFRYLFGDPERIYCSTRPDPRTPFPHTDGICLYLLEYDSGLRCASWDDVWSGPAREGAAEEKGIRWRVEGTAGLALGTIGWPDYPEGSPSTIAWSTTADDAAWHAPSWPQRWFPDAFGGPMSEVLNALAGGAPLLLNARDNLRTMALVEAAYLSAAEHRAVSPAELLAAADA